MRHKIYGKKTGSFCNLGSTTAFKDVIEQVYTGRFIMFSGITKNIIIGKTSEIYLRTVANVTVAKNTDIHIPSRRKSRPLPL